MKRVLRLMGLPFGMLCLAASITSAAEVVERIIAVVNDEIVTEQDLDYAMGPVVAQYRTRYSGEELEEKVGAAREEFLNKVIEDKLVLSEAKRLQVIVKDEEVDEMLADVRNKFPTREAFQSAIQEQGLTEKKLWSRFRDQLMTQKLVSYEVKSKVSVSPGEVAEYYRAHADEFQQGDRVRLRHILVRTASRSEEEALALCQSYLDQARQGADFQELAKAHSEGSEAAEGGQMGWIEKGRFLGEIDEKIFALQEGGIAGPIKSSLGYHLFKLEERQQSSLRPLEEVRAKIQDLIFKRKLGERLDAWMKGLKKNAYISIR